jgi:hypothetical protein
MHSHLSSLSEHPLDVCPCELRWWPRGSRDRGLHVADVSHGHCAVRAQNLVLREVVEDSILRNTSNASGSTGFAPLITAVLLPVSLRHAECMSRALTTPFPLPSRILIPMLAANPSSTSSEGRGSNLPFFFSHPCVLATLVILRLQFADYVAQRQEATVRSAPPRQ